MKFLLLISSFLFLSPAFAKDCEVGGISDSPQKLHCVFPETTIELTCRRGTYYLNSSKVSVAYHLEVEEGSNPLVFKTTDMNLTVVMELPNQYSAELVKGKTQELGSCGKL